MALSHLLISIRKEFTLLKRDISGLILLFLMPTVLVILITLIQDRVTNTQVKVLLIDRDKGEISSTIQELFSLSDNITLVQHIQENEDLDEQKARELLSKGTYQFAIVLPEQLSQHARQQAKQQVSNTGLSENATPEIHLLFDPTVQGGFRTAVTEALLRVTQGIESRLLIEYGVEKLINGMPETIKTQLPPGGLNINEELPQLFQTSSFISINQQFSAGMDFILQPTAVQQNVPAWAIFGIFLTVVPLSGSIIKERNSGIYARTQILPTSFWILTIGRILAYMIICAIQFLLILVAGIYLLPLLGTSPFEPGNSSFLIAFLIFSVTAAACGYGLFLGTICKTNEQSAVIGPVSIVIAAAIGGVMVPVYALPQSLRIFSNFSPLYWGQNGFYDLLLRQGTLHDLLPECTLLLAFCILMLTLSFIITKLKYE